MPEFWQTKGNIKMENKVLATVGGMPITSADVDEFILSLGQRGAGYNSPEGREMVLSQLIDSKLLLLDARRNLYETEAEFKAKLARFKENLLVNYAAEKAVKSAKAPTERDALKFYEENPDKFTEGEVVNASHILVATEEEALSVLAEIKSGDISFEDAAKKYSSCPSKENGGSLGEFTRGQMVPEFDSAVFAMAIGTVTETPVKTQFGYHLIKLNSKSESSVVAFDAVKDNILAHLAESRERDALTSKLGQLKILYPVDKF